jgi:hypothetical protein
MKETRGIRCLWIWLWLPTLGRQVIRNIVRATDRLVIPLVEFADVMARSPALVGKRIGVFRLISCLSKFHRVLGSQVSIARTTKIVIQWMKKEDTRRVVGKCPRTPCSRTLVGSPSREAAQSYILVRCLKRNFLRFILCPVSTCAPFNAEPINRS